MRRSSLRHWGLTAACRLIRQDRGFTLVEVLVATMILAVAMAVIFRVTSDGVRNTQRADALADATALTQALLAKVGNEIPLQEAELRGQESADLRWRVRMERYGDAADREQWPMAAYVVVAEVTWGDRPSTRPITLQTLRLGRK